MPPVFNDHELDHSQILPRVYEEETGELRVKATIVPSASPIEVIIDHTNDSIKIGDGTDFLSINPDGSINVNAEIDAADGDNIAISGHPNPIFESAADTIATSGLEEIFSYTSTDDDTRIRRVIATAGTASLFRLSINGSAVMELRSSPLQRNVTFEFDEHIQLASGEELTIEARVERFFAAPAPYTTFTSLQGYVL